MSRWINHAGQVFALPCGVTVACIAPTVDGSQWRSIVIASRREDIRCGDTAFVPAQEIASGRARQLTPPADEPSAAARVPGYTPHHH
jgi:hypothetical protein